MAATEREYQELFGQIEIEQNNVAMAKCNCIACNSCGCHPRCFSSEWEEIQW